MSNNTIFGTEITVEKIEYVWNGIYMPRSNHMINRGYHGLVLIRDNPHIYTFDNGMSIEAKPGHILYLPKGCSYRINDIKACNCVAINFNITEDTDYPPEQFDVKEQMQEYSELFQIASRFWDGKYTGYSFKIKSILYQILYLMNMKNHLEYVSKKTAEKLSFIIEYIGTHYTEKELSVKSLSDLLDISEVYFRNQFRKAYGVTPMQYIKQIRMTRAIELLESDMYKVSEVAHIIGYSSEYYFCREFKKFTGLTPMKFKKEAIDKKLYDSGIPFSRTDM